MGMKIFDVEMSQKDGATVHWFKPDGSVAVELVVEGEDFAIVMDTLQVLGNLLKQKNRKDFSGRKIIGLTFGVLPGKGKC